MSISKVAIKRQIKIRFKKAGCLAISLLLLASPIETLAYTQSNSSNGVTEIHDDISNVNVLAKNAKVDYSKNEIEPNIYEVNVDVDLVQRTLVNLDVVKIRNMNNILNQDYKTDIKDRVEDLVPEIKHADVIEYEGFSNSFRDSVTVDSESSTDYASKLDYLINNNIINRTTYFLYNETGASASQNRTPRPKEIESEGKTNLEDKTSGNETDEVSKSRKDEEEADETSYLHHKYYYPKHKISKTDFLTEMMKIDGIEESRPIFVTTDYKRVMENLQEYSIISEPVESSPYAKALGLTGLDYGTNDIVVWHDNFGQQEILVTNDVSEYYLQKALNKNIVSEDEIGGTEGSEMLDDMKKAVKDGYMNTHKAIRQYYNTGVKLHEKILEKDIVYPEDMVKYPEKYQKIQKDILDISSNSDQGTLPPWGRTYYSNAANCVFANPFSVKPVELLKRPSIVEVGNKYWQYSAPESMREKVGEENGYAYFKKEEITVAEAYLLAYKMLLALGTESKLTPTEVNYLNSKYSLNFTTFTAEEREATEYLIAKGIVDGNGEYLYTASSTPLTNEVAIDIIYRIANSDARIDFTPQLSAIDINMATQGYSQTTITKTNNDIGDIKVYEDVTKGKKVFTKGTNGEEVEFKGGDGITSYTSLQNSDRVSNPSVYDLVYIRLPKVEENTGSDSTVYFKLVTDNEYRTLIDPINKGKLDYGNSSTTEVGKKIEEEWKKAEGKLSKDIKDGEVAEELKATENGDWVFKDKDGYLWRRYLIHKSMSSKVMLVGYSNNASYTFRGIRGEGLYIVEDNVKTGDFRKVSLFDGKDLSPTERISKVLVTFDENVRNYVKLSDTAEVDTLGNSISLAGAEESILWSQNNYMAEDDADAKISSIYLDKDKMDMYLYDGNQFFVKNDNGGFDINPDLNITEKVRKSFVKLAHDTVTGNYYLQYKSPYQDYMENTIRDVTNKISLIGAKTGSDDDVTMPGYARITQKGNEVALVTDAELQNTYGIEKKSEKMLYNAKTGQRAFFNTIDSTTLIGNNVTRYPENQLIVTAHGEGNDKILYYNLHAALELINNTNVVAKTAGTNIYTAIGDTASALKKSYRLIDIKDVNKGTASSGYTTVDRTYIETASTLTTPNYFMNLSALCGSASNFIYYKDKVLDLDLLLVYTPYINNTTLTQYKGPAKVAVDNSLLKSTSSIAGKDTIISSSVNLGDALENDVKTQIFNAIFGISEVDAVRGILNGPYNLDIHLLVSKAADDDMLKSKFGDLITLLTNNEPARIKTLKDSTYKLEDVFKTNAFSDFEGREQLIDGTNLTIDSIKVGTVLTDSSEFVKCNDSGNLYYRIYGKSGNSSKANVVGLKDKLGTRFYYDTKNTTATDDDVILMRRKINYSNTGDDYIPLEMFSMPEYRSGLALSNSSGHFNYNISDNKKVKLTSPDKTSASHSANVYITKKRVGTEGASDIGLATMVELPYQELSAEDIKKLFAKNVFTIDQKGTHASFLNTFFKMVTEVFDSNMDGYKLSDAMGVNDNVSVTVGWDYEGCDNEKEQFLQGMWHISDSNSYYMPARVEPTQSQTETPITYAMIVGNVTPGDTVYPTHDAIMYLGKVMNVGNDKTIITDITPFKSYEELPERIRYYIESGDSSYLTADQQTINTSHPTAKISSSPIKIVYKPSIAIPAGTTLLKSSTSGSPIDTFILAPHKVETEYSSSIRSVLFTAKDVVNTCLALEQEDPTFLYQVPKGSHITIGDVDFIKYSSPDSDSKHLTWVRCLSTPTYTSDNQSVVTLDRDKVSEMTLLTQYITQIYGLGIPIGGGAANIGTIQLGEVMGPGAYRIPTIGELRFLNDMLSKKSWAGELYSKLSRVFGFSTSSNLTNTMSNTYMTYNPLIYDLTDNKLMVSTDASVKDASVILTLNLPPSLQVIENPDLEDTFDVVGYWDINQFNVDPSEEMVSYLKSKDTEVVALDAIIKDIKATDVSGLPYLNTAEEEKVQFTMSEFIKFIVYAIPAIAFIIWIIRTVFLVIFSFNKSREWADRINTAVGINIMTPLTLGIYRSNQGELDIMRYIIMSILFSGILAVIYGKFIIIWVGNIFGLRIM